MKKLIADEKHKKIDASKKGIPIKRITSGLIAGGMAISMYSGALSKLKASAEELDNNNSIVYIDEDSRKIDLGEQVLVEHSYDICQFTVGEAKNASGDLNITFYDDKYDLSDLKYFENIKELNLYFGFPCNIFDSLESMPVMPNVETLFFMYGYNSELDEKHIDMLREKFPNLKSVNLSDAIINPVFAEKMTGLEELSIKPAINCDIDFTKFTYLKKLKLGSLPYTTPVYFNTNEYNTLCNAGVEVMFGDYSDDASKNKDIYLDVSKKIDDIVQNLNISENSTDKEKLDAILIFVMEKLQYDSGVREAIASGNNDLNTCTSFYKNGLLDAVFTKDTAICGNYSALVDAIYDRIGSPEKSIIVNSESHSWNLINIEGELYYVDSTWLDDENISTQIVESYVDEQGIQHILTSYDHVSSIDAIKEGKTDKLEWYMNSDFDSDPAHHTLDMAFPEYVLSKGEEEDKTELNQVIESQVSVDDSSQVQQNNDNNKDKKEIVLDDSSNKKVSINVNGKTIGITLGALVGVLTSAGLAVHINKKKKLARERRMQQLDELENDDYFDYSSSYSDGYSDFYSDDYSDIFGFKK